MRFAIVVTSAFALASCRPAEPSTVVAIAPPTVSTPAPIVHSGAPEVRAWFSITQKKTCDSGSPEYGKCYVVTLTLHGSVEREIVVAKNQWGQEYCGVEKGKSVACGGASGATTITLQCSTGGSCDVLGVSESDGYCPPPEDCTTKMSLTSFTIPANAMLTFAQ
jgi:hypothetical protein